MPCRFCGQPFEAHKLHAGRYTPRMPCLGLRSGYLEREAYASEDGGRRRAAPAVFDDEVPDTSGERP